MQRTAKVTSKRRITVPKDVRQAFGIQEGDEVLLRVEDHLVTLTRTPSFLDLADTFSVPPARHHTVWGQVLWSTRATRAVKRL